VPFVLAGMRICRAFAKANASVHIRRPKIDKLACQAKGVRITKRSAVTVYKMSFLRFFNFEFPYF